MAELARQALSSVEQGYDLLAPKFDLTPYRTPEAIIAGALAVIGGANAVDDVLDLCCGSGAALRRLRAMARRRAVGLDLSRGMLDAARRHCADAPGEALLEFVKGDALALPFCEEFDLVTSFGAFGHILESDEPRLVAGIARALRPGGRFVFVTAEPPHPLSPRTLEARAFNLAMRLRNALWSPPFVMYYLTFLRPRAEALLAAEGLQVTVHRGALPAAYRRLLVIEARKP